MKFNRTDRKQSIQGKIQIKCKGKTSQEILEMMNKEILAYVRQYNLQKSEEAKIFMKIDDLL